MTLPAPWIEPARLPFLVLPHGSGRVLRCNGTHPANHLTAALGIWIT